RAKGATRALVREASGGESNSSSPGDCLRAAGADGNARIPSGHADRPANVASNTSVGAHTASGDAAANTGVTDAANTTVLGLLGVLEHQLGWLSDARSTLTRALRLRAVDIPALLQGGEGVDEKGVIGAEEGRLVCWLADCLRDSLHQEEASSASSLAVLTRASREKALSHPDAARKQGCADREEDVLAEASAGLYAIAARASPRDGSIALRQTILFAQTGDAVRLVEASDRCSALLAPALLPLPTALQGEAEEAQQTETVSGEGGGGVGEEARAIDRRREASSMLLAAGVWVARAAGASAGRQREAEGLALKYQELVPLLEKGTFESSQTGRVIPVVGAKELLGNATRLRDMLLGIAEEEGRELKKMLLPAALRLLALARRSRFLALPLALRGGKAWKEAREQQKQRYPKL
ncbi:hypothetical protein T484DRAFT_1850392, partial [Baffinella frigidus]